MGELDLTDMPFVDISEKDKIEKIERYKVFEMLFEELPDNVYTDLHVLLMELEKQQSEMCKVDIEVQKVPQVQEEESVEAHLLVQPVETSE